jgi:hypothetical protein
MKVVNGKVIFKKVKEVNVPGIHDRARSLWEQEKVPVVLYKIDSDHLIRGVICMGPGMESLGVLTRCSHHLNAYGGKDGGYGFTLREDEWDGFKECLESSIPTSGP